MDTNEELSIICKKSDGRLILISKAKKILVKSSASRDDGRCGEFWSASNIHVHSAVRNVYTNPAQVTKYIARTEVSTSTYTDVIAIHVYV